MINPNNKNILTKKNYNYIQNRLKFLKEVTKILRKDAKILKYKGLILSADCLDNIRTDIFYELRCIRQGGLKDV